MAAQSFRHLRHSTGLSQAAFARLLGVNQHTVEAIEQGRCEVSPRVANAAFVATGTIPAFLQLPDSLAPEAQAWTRQPYTPDLFPLWQTMTSGDLLRGTSDHTFADVTKSFFDAAETAGKLGAFQAQIALSLHAAAHETGIADEARALAHERGDGAAFDFLASIAGRIQK